MEDQQQSDLKWWWRAPAHSILAYLVWLVFAGFLFWLFYFVVIVHGESLFDGVKLAFMMELPSWSGFLQMVFMVFWWGLALLVALVLLAPIIYALIFVGVLIWLGTR